MRIDNGRYREVVMNWTGITPPLKAGTPISAAGTIANNGNAIGIVPVQVITQTVMPRSIFILDAGDVDLAEVEALSGLTLSADAKATMSAIRFHKADGTIDDSADKDTDTVYQPPYTIFVTTEDGGTYLSDTWDTIHNYIMGGVLVPVVTEGEGSYAVAYVTAMAEGDDTDEDNIVPWTVTLSDSTVWGAVSADDTLYLSE